MLIVVDEFTNERITIRIDRKLKSTDISDVLANLFITRGLPEHMRSDNEPELIATAVQTRIATVGAKTTYIAAGSPWENGFVESFDARLRDELLKGEIFYSLAEARAIIEAWRRHSNTAPPLASIGHRPPAPEVFVPALAGVWPAPRRAAAPPATVRADDELTNVLDHSTGADQGSQPAAGITTTRAKPIPAQPSSQRSLTACRRWMRFSKPQK